jgi:hypothetical protein
MVFQEKNASKLNEKEENSNFVIWHSQVVYLGNR